MAKSKNNGVDPEDLIRKFGADSLRLFILFASPPEKELEWSEAGAEGSFRFINRVWRLVQAVIKNGESTGAGIEAETADEKALLYAMNAAIKKTTLDIGDRFNFNTAISSIMEFVNAMYKALETGVRHAITSSAVENLILILSPFAPHVCDEMREALGHKTPALLERWPSYDESALARDTEEIAVQINGKLRGKITIASGLTARELEEIAADSDEVKALTDGQKIVKVIGVPGRLISIVVK